MVPRWWLTNRLNRQAYWLRFHAFIRSLGQDNNGQEVPRSTAEPILIPAPDILTIWHVPFTSYLGAQSQTKASLMTQMVITLVTFRHETQEPSKPESARAGAVLNHDGTSAIPNPNPNPSYPIFKKSN